ncbi:MAG: nucleotidyltransferase family protein [Pseudarcicella sp.]|nr:nucleotidyltransferase family protein [Pseudarcicella sp.]MBP6410171.1 nucleotidyltransferase family protein [Pseudarcicella sp.]
MDLQKNLISVQSTAREALRKLDSEAKGITAPVLFVYDLNQKIVGSLTDGDIRRGLINNLGIDDTVKDFMFADFRFFSPNNITKTEIQSLKSRNIRFVPVLDENKLLLKIIDLQINRSNIPASAVIMAGGRGERLIPLTDHTPKPMLKVGGKPIIEYNIEHLVRHGITDIYISVRYLGEQLMEYFGDGTRHNARIQYITEDKPLGTIGALNNIADFEENTILVMNSDLLTNVDFEQLYEAFVLESADMAVATIPYDVNVPFAVMELENGNVVKSFKEKPKYTFYSNAGIYLFKKELAQLIVPDQKYDATDLMNDVIASGKKLIAEPILNYWLDIGRMEDFYKAQEDIKHLKF